MVSTGSFWVDEALKVTALDPTGGPLAKQRLERVRDALIQERTSTLDQIQQQAKSSVNTCTDIIREARFAAKDERRTSWGEYGPNQGNVGKHIDALAGVVYGLDIAIFAITEILKGGPNERSTDEGSEEQEAAEEAGTRAGKDSAPVKPKRKRSTSGKRN